jgi:HEAT repeat protein
MLTEFLTKRRTRRLVQQAYQINHPHRAASVRELGSLPLTAESFECLTALLNDPSSEIVRIAIRELANFDDARVSLKLAARLAVSSDRETQNQLLSFLSDPKHYRAVPALVRFAESELRKDARRGWRVLDKPLRTIGTAEALSALKQFKPKYVARLLEEARQDLALFPYATWVDEYLEEVDTREAREALETVRRERVPVLLRAALFDDSYNRVALAVELLEQYAFPEAMEALKEFRLARSRILPGLRTEFHEEQSEEADRVDRWTTETEVWISTSNLGQELDPHEEERAQATRKRQEYLNALNEVAAKHRPTLAALIDRGQAKCASAFKEMVNGRGFHKSTARSLASQVPEIFAEEVTKYITRSPGGRDASWLAPLLGSCGTAAFPAIRRLLDSRDWLVRRRGEEALKGLDPEAQRDFHSMR